MRTVPVNQSASPLPSMLRRGATERHVGLYLWNPRRPISPVSLTPRDNQTKNDPERRGDDMRTTWKGLAARATHVFLPDAFRRYARANLILKALALIVGLGVAQNATAANLLVNGGFENPPQVSPNFATFNIPAGSTTITGWTIVQGNVDLTYAVDYGPLGNTLDPASVQDVDLIGDTNGSGGVFGGLSQSFATTAGQEYQLTFDYSHNPGTASSSGYAAQVTVADGNAPGNSIFSGQVSQANGTATWVAFSQDFTAISDLTLLSIIDTQGAFNAGIYLDDVDVEPVNPSATPLPGALPLFAGGLWFTAYLSRRRQRRTAAA